MDSVVFGTSLRGNSGGTCGVKKDWSSLRAEANRKASCVTGESLPADDLISVKTNKAVKPRPLQAASIPGMLGLFQNEWDALMLSNYALEQQLHTARQELSHALYQVNEATVQDGFTSAAFHPDGLILGTGTAESLVRIWDVKTQANVAKFEGHTGPVTDISFSENGYFLATAASDGVKLWDLRKLKNFRSFAPYDAATPTNTVEFDYSGSYLAVGGSDIRIYQVASVKQEWNTVKVFPDLSGTGKVTSVRFGPDASYLAVATMDRQLRILGAPTSGLETSAGTP
ncbi:hypothetical protein AXG93_3507s1090 [Marchantia polymorpha subsp. ruderalis]|uniref:Pre-mRNA-processing factor 19 n=1 Tax=Marchantia polymorpha subsp. ruderalis TaxID=1480154 RepID=A0A176VE67_MARPO|nr:hypothetical protein AXG93_3507s1090 [Marchantia polymorpha subsp. ruderalis]